MNNTFRVSLKIQQNDNSNTLHKNLLILVVWGIGYIDLTTHLEEVYLAEY